MNETTLRFVSLGFEHVVQANMVWQISRYKTIQVKRMVQQARKEGMLLDWTARRGIRSAVFLTNGYVIASPFNVKTLLGRLCRAVEGDMIVSDDVPTDEEEDEFVPEIDSDDEFAGGEEDMIDKDS